MVIFAKEERAVEVLKPRALWSAERRRRKDAIVAIGSASGWWRLSAIFGRLIGLLVML